MKPHQQEKHALNNHGFYQGDEDRVREILAQPVDIPDGNHVKLPDPAKPGESAKSSPPAEHVTIGDAEDQQEPEGDTGEIQASGDAPMWAGALSEELRSCATVDEVDMLRKDFEKNVEPGDEDGFNLLHDMCDEAAKYIGAQA